jgi:hypothetical protein
MHVANWFVKKKRQIGRLPHRFLVETDSLPETTCRHNNNVCVTNDESGIHEPGHLVMIDRSRWNGSKERLNDRSIEMERKQTGHVDTESRRWR